MVLTRLSTAGMRANASKSKFFAEQIEYMSYWMGIKIAPDVFQNVTSKLTQDLECEKTYLDDLLILTNSSFADHLTKL
jgi:hypothetical protein